MQLEHLDRSDRRTIELIIERYPDIKDDLSRVLHGFDRAVSEKAEQIENFKREVLELKQEIEDLQN
jgi:archaellum component FlaC